MTTRSNSFILGIGPREARNDGPFGTVKYYGSYEYLIGSNWQQDQLTYDGYVVRNIATQRPPGNSQPINPKELNFALHTSAIDDRNPDPNVIEGPLKSDYQSDDFFESTAQDFVNFSVPDRAFMGPGNDIAYGRRENDLLVGGDGDDALYGGIGNDTLYGDYTNAPVYNLQSGAAQGLFYSLHLPITGSPALAGIGGAPAPIGDDQLFGQGGHDKIYGGGGDDLLSGGTGGDQLFGEDGDDQLYAGPRGQVSSDLAVGGAGADIFYLSYSSADMDANTANQFWSAFGVEVARSVGKSAAKDAVVALAKFAIEDFYTTFSGGMLVGTIAGSFSALVSTGIKSLFSASKQDSNAGAGSDLLVIGDFDPREDVLFLPVTKGQDVFPVFTTTEGGSYTEYDGVRVLFQSIESGGSGGNVKVFADLRLSQDFIDDVGLTNQSAALDSFVRNVFQSAITIDEAGNIIGGSNALPTDTSDYVDGFVPASVVDVADLGWSTPAGTSTRVYGAFAPWDIREPASLSTIARVSGTNLGDRINVNGTSFAPQDALNGQNKLTKESTVIHAWMGDDIIFGGDGSDTIYGGPGDDQIFVIGGLINDWENIQGEEGDDRIYLGIGQSRIFADGGTGTDVADFIYLNEALTVDLSITGEGGTPYSAASIGPSTLGNATHADPIQGTAVSRYAIINVEGIRGSTKSDDITGNAGGTVFYFSGGSDTIHAIGAGNRYSFALEQRDTSSDTGVQTVVAHGTGANALRFTNTVPTGSGSSSSTDTIYGTPAITLSPFADTFDARAVTTGLSVDAGAGNDQVTGSAGDDTLSGGDGDDTLTGGGGNDNLDGGAGRNTVHFADNGANGVVVDLAANPGNGSGAVGSWRDAFGGRDTVNRETVQAYHGTSARDIFTGDGGGGTNPLFSADFYGEGGDDSITGSGLGEILDGGSGNDVLKGLAGDDTLTGGAGNDSLNGGAGQDTVHFADNGANGVVVDLAASPGGGSGAIGSWRDAFGGRDTVDRATVEAYRGTSARDILKGDGGGGTNPLFSADFYGEGGNDSITGSGLGEILDGGEGNDVLMGLAGDDWIDGGAGVDTLDGGQGADFFTSLQADWIDDVVRIDLSDTLRIEGRTEPVVGSILSGNLVFLDFGDGTGFYFQGESPATILGFRQLIHEGDTYLYGAHSPFKISDDKGPDTFYGTIDRDVFDGGPGDDQLYGDGPEMFLPGAAGAGDRLFGRDGNDALYGGPGDDVLIGGGGMDTVYGGEGDDRVMGDGRWLRLWKKPGGEDIVDGGPGNDFVRAGISDDIAKYGVGENAGASDRYDGGSGFDTLQLIFTGDEWASFAQHVRDDLDAFDLFLDRVTGRDGEARGAVFEFQSFDLDISRFEAIEVVLAGIGSIDPDEYG